MPGSGMPANQPTWRVNTTTSGRSCPTHHVTAADTRLRRDSVGLDNVGDRTAFHKLNVDWNAEPNAPYPEIRFDGQALLLTFYLNPYVFPRFKLGDCGELTFPSCWRYRLGGTNDEGWWRKQCRFSLIAPEWGEFYEVTGNLRLDRIHPDRWSLLSDPPAHDSRHFLFYFRDETFECDASGWSFRAIPAVGDVTASWRRVSLPSGSSILMVPPRSGSIGPLAHVPLDQSGLSGRQPSWIRRTLNKWL
jgi:hypothetical protein